MGAGDSDRTELDALRQRLEQQREVLGLAGMNPEDRARRRHAHAAGVHMQAAYLHQRAAELFQAHALEVAETQPGQAAAARRLADREREMSAREFEAAGKEQAKAEVCPEPGGEPPENAQPSPTPSAWS